MSVSVDTDLVPRPTNLFVADYSDVRVTPDAVGLIFGKTHPYGGALAHIVEVSITRRSFIDLVWPTVVGPFTATLREVCARQYGTWETSESGDVEDAEYVPIQANMAKMSYAGEDAAIDFYLFSVHDMSLILRGAASDLEVTAVLRVMLSTPRLLAVLDRCKELLDLEDTTK